MKVQQWICIAATSFFFACHAEKTDRGFSSFTAPPNIPASILKGITDNRDVFVPELKALLSQDSENLLIFVDKAHLLPSDFVPDNLVLLATAQPYQIGKKGMTLTATAEAALSKMGNAAKKDGITLLASSAYRSWEYQKTVYERNVRELGQDAADRESARPGTSQHQLGTALDFGSITDDFARTEAGKWMAAHAAQFGWSLSYPDGYEAVTGYRWESWHYRYIGIDAAAFQKKWFGDVQQYMLEYIDAWKKHTLTPGL